MNERELLRDRYGTIIGQIVYVGSRQTLRDRYGNILGWYEPSTDLTHDKHRTMIGRGDVCSTAPDDRLAPTAIGDELRSMTNREAPTLSEMLGDSGTMAGRFHLVGRRP